jgi:hypothetical protein
LCAIWEPGLRTHPSIPTGTYHYRKAFTKKALGSKQGKVPPLQVFSLSFQPVGSIQIGKARAEYERVSFLGFLPLFHGLFLP